MRTADRKKIINTFFKNARARRDPSTGVAEVQRVQLPGYLGSAHFARGCRWSRSLGAASGQSEYWPTNGRTARRSSTSLYRLVGFASRGLPRTEASPRRFLLVARLPVEHTDENETKSKIMVRKRLRAKCSFAPRISLNWFSHTNSSLTRKFQLVVASLTGSLVR